MKQYRSLTRTAFIGLMLLLSQAYALAQTAGQSDKIARLKVEDPNGFVLTITAVLVVFSALITLAIVFTSVGKLMQKFSGETAQQGQAPKKAESKKPKKVSKNAPSEDVSVAISMALTQELQARSEDVVVAIAMALREELECQHDEESYCLTIQHRPTQWNARSQSMRQYDY